MVLVQRNGSEEPPASLPSSDNNKSPRLYSLESPYCAYVPPRLARSAIALSFCCGASIPRRAVLFRFSGTVL
ncbi:hypothetical protein BOTBODRAFT_33480 [Botryobasidium botryosum FD-172 SS1]|uniref:Uncharacterized protein n=1 Tax=Botryobasidium botryosum (strain FD-172 SS1) TaxID=930990 RepID=A0A067MPF2_BOTB1|nr:hypothetical protein BOTBODRAFT_33480 [Botryobasidium botryosum FD-172 SS1]